MTKNHGSSSGRFRAGCLLVAWLGHFEFASLEWFALTAVSETGCLDDDVGEREAVVLQINIVPLCNRCVFVYGVTATKAL
jgi:hypothetical protein